MSNNNISKREEEILAYWEKEKIFEKTLSKDSPKGKFIFFEGPPTANGKPGIHHVEARAFKDLIPRFRTMQGYSVPRKAGWDTHGLPVEIEVEKKLGLSSKKEIEEYGIAAFNEECKKSVWKYLEDWNYITRRIGFWLDLENPYVTYNTDYIESVWWIIKKIYEKGMLYKDYKVVPYCPRCGTPLSSHELAQGYKEVEDPAVYVKFKLVDEENTFIIAWTTTPWTLPSNVALMVSPDITYVKVKKNGEFYWIAKSRVEEATEGDYEIVGETDGAHLVGKKYEPLFPYLNDLAPESEQEKMERAFQVVPASIVSMDEGSGVVHTAVMYGVDDFEVGNKLGLPKFHLVGTDGKFIEGCGAYSGKFVKGADAGIIAELEERGLLLGKGKVLHSYPFCWRCKTPLIYYARDSWFIKMSALKSELQAQNEGIHWVPDHIKEGRFGEWLKEIKDWAFSRERYWGTPLPIWNCADCGAQECIGSFEELRSRSKTELKADFDPHRPHVDDVEFVCSCGSTMHRASEVIDVWFDSGCMPFAQWHYPFENKEKIDNNEAYPADYISEAIDQTRGWFYTMHAVGALLGYGRAYKNVICLGHVLDSQGKKMSKSLGNIVEPLEMINKHGADALRWYMYTINQPGDSKKFEEEILAEMVKKVFMILNNSVSFYLMYEQKFGVAEVVESKNILDKWIEARAHKLVKSVTEQLENYEVTEPAREIGDFISELSQWYIRRSRDRFKGDDNTDRTAALSTLRNTLLTVAKLLAPFTPFIAESVYMDLHGPKASVHLEDWPIFDPAKIDEKLLDDMERTRAIVSHALERRSEAKINVRQPLSSLTVTTPGAELEKDLLDLIADEVNVKEVRVLTGNEMRTELDLTITPELAQQGAAREIVRRVNALRKEAGLTIEDVIILYAQTSDAETADVLKNHADEIKKQTLADRLEFEKADVSNEAEVEINGNKLWIGLKKI